MRAVDQAMVIKVLFTMFPNLALTNCVFGAIDSSAKGRPGNGCLGYAKACVLAAIAL